MEQNRATIASLADAAMRGGRPLPGFLDRVHREVEGDAARVAEALVHADPVSETVRDPEAVAGC